MMLSERQSSAIASKTGSEVILENAPAQRKLERIFGKHTFFKSENGVFKVEPITDPKRPKRALVRRIPIASWADKSKTTVEPIEGSAGSNRIKI